MTKMKFMGYLVQIIIVALVAGLLSNAVSFLIKSITSTVAGKITTFAISLVALWLVIFSRQVRPGKEDALDLIISLIGISSIYLGLDALGVSMFSFVSDFTLPIGMALTISTVFFTEALYLKVFNKFLKKRFKVLS